MDIKNYTMPVAKKIVCLGDSITAGYWDEEGLGYVSRLSQKIAREYPLQYGVINAGISGDTILDAWHNLISSVVHHEPQALVIKVGVNDVYVGEGIAPESHHTSVLDRLNTWMRILDFCQKMKWEILVVGPIPVEHSIVRFQAHEGSAEGQTGFRYQNADILDYNDRLQKLCAQKNVPFLRLFETWVKALDQGLFTDGLHPNAKGHKLLAEQVFDGLKKFKIIKES